MPTLRGTAGADTITGGVDADTISGLAGGDVLTGGAGFDLFIVGDGDSPAAQALNDPSVIDVITDWRASDRIMFQGAGQPVFGSLLPGLADDYQGAYNLAISAFGVREFAAVQVGPDVYLFAMRTGQVVKLANADVADVQRVSFSYGSLDGGLTETGPDTPTARTLTAGTDNFTGGRAADTIQGLTGADTLAGGAGDDQVFGGPDNDSITGGAGANYLRGDDGDDVIQGGDDFDDINGNVGRDTITAGAGDDWAVGGKDNDVIFGEGGGDLVYGNLGNDTLGGGVGADIVRGGQGDDLVRGDDGNDTLSGDRGTDTIDGGIGADLFLSFAETGLDYVRDFSFADGDRVRLDPGTTYTLFQDGADTVIDMGFGNRMILLGVTLTSLPNGWITVG